MPLPGDVRPKITKRKQPPSQAVYEARRTWGGRLLVELNSIKKNPKWLGAKVGYKLPGSMSQVINGHQGISREVYEKIVAIVPEMGVIEPPPMTVEEQGGGAPGPHKQHEYPKIGPINARRARVIKRGR